LNKFKDGIKDSNVGWNASNLFYIFLNELDMDYRDAYYTEDWDKMYKVFELKYMKVRIFILKKATDNEKELLDDDKTIQNLISEFKQGDTDFVNKNNNEISNNIRQKKKKKMILIDELMSKAGMNILMEKIKEDRPASMGTDDF